MIFTHVERWSLDDDPGDIASPCISVCRMDAMLGDDAARAAGGLCVGCLRTLDEIIAWGSAGSHEKRAILDAVDARRRALRAA